MEKTGQSALPGRTLVLIALVTAIWGFNFIVIKIGVSGVPPLFLAACRFALSALPAVFFVRKPPAPQWRLALYGLLLGLGEFGFLFTAIKLGAPAGLSSVILQFQAFFTALLAAVILKETVRANSVIGMATAALGLVLIALPAVTGSGGPGGTAGTRGGPGGFLLWPLVMVVLAAFFWAGANIAAQGLGKTGGLSLVVWSSLYSPLPLFGLSFLLERDEILPALSNLEPLSIGALAYLVLLSTLFGYGLWNQLIMRHGAKRIAPFSLLVPVFGVAAGTLVLGETFTAGNALASVLILAGLAIHVFGGKRPMAGKAPERSRGA